MSTEHESASYREALVIHHPGVVYRTVSGVRSFVVREDVDGHGFDDSAYASPAHRMAVKVNQALEQESHSWLKGWDGWTSRVKRGVRNQLADCRGTGCSFDIYVVPQELLYHIPQVCFENCSHKISDHNMTTVSLAPALFDRLTLNLRIQRVTTAVDSLSTSLLPIYTDDEGKGSPSNPSFSQVSLLALTGDAESRLHHQDGLVRASYDGTPKNRLIRCIAVSVRQTASRPSMDKINTALAAADSRRLWVQNNTELWKNYPGAFAQRGAFTRHVVSTLASTFTDDMFDIYVLDQHKDHLTQEAASILKLQEISGGHNVSTCISHEEMQYLAEELKSKRVLPKSVSIEM